MSSPDATLTALIDAFLPTAEAPPGGIAYPSASSAGVDRAILELAAQLPDEPRRGFQTLLTTVESRGLNLLLGGRPQRFSTLDPAGRERYLLRWSRSRLAAKRRGFQAIKRLAAGLYFSAPTVGETHPLWERIHYRPPRSEPVGLDPLAEFAPRPPTWDGPRSVDVVVVGTGAGGAVVAAQVAAAGYRTAILEAGAWREAARFPRIERDAHRDLFFESGVATSDDLAIGLLAGRGVGGSTTINWMTCLPPRAEARREWAELAGMAGTDGPAFDRLLATVWERFRVNAAESDVNPPNEALRRGCTTLGYTKGTDWDIISRNAIGCRSRCGFCTFGCPYSARQSSASTFLVDALRSGAELYPETTAESVELAGGRATGVRATSRAGGTVRPIELRARAVVLAGGALQTPALLLRSGVRHPGVGRGLRLDPTTALAGEFPYPMRTWEGPHQTVGVYRFQTTDAGGHGPWIESSPAHPGLAAIALPWRGAAPFRQQMERLERVATPIVLVRDTGEGRVTIDRDGRPRFHYRLTTRDRRNLLRGLRETARILAAAGATRLLSLQTIGIEVGDGSRPLRPDDIERFAAAMEHEGIRENAIALFSAHPMGSARAGTDSRSSTARPTGEVHGVDGLWIGDGSLLPTAPGVNPMISIAAVALRTSGFLLDALGAS